MEDSKQIPQIVIQEMPKKVFVTGSVVKKQTDLDVLKNFSSSMVKVSLKTNSICLVTEK